MSTRSRPYNLMNIDIKSNSTTAIHWQVGDTNERDNNGDGGEDSIFGSQYTIGEAHPACN